MQMQQTPPSGSSTVFMQGPAASAQPNLALRSQGPVSSADAGLPPLDNIPRRASELVQTILGSELFTPEQKTLARSWEGHFIQLLNHHPLRPAKAVCFLGIKVITPAIVHYQDNRLAMEQLIPFVRGHRELLMLLLPENTDVEGFIIQNEEVYSLMLETKKILNDIQTLNQETERLLCQSADGLKDRIVSNSNQDRATLRGQAQRWREQIRMVEEKLRQLKQHAEDLKGKFQEHSQELVTIGTQLADEQRHLNGMVAELQHLLNRV